MLAELLIVERLWELVHQADRIVILELLVDNLVTVLDYRLGNFADLKKKLCYKMRRITAVVKLTCAENSPTCKVNIKMENFFIIKIDWKLIPCFLRKQHNTIDVEWLILVIFIAAPYAPYFSHKLTTWLLLLFVLRWKWNNFFFNFK